MTTETQLHKDALGLGESVVMGVAGTAPAFSVSATTATLIAVVGVLSAASLLYCGLIMFGITLAFMHLNRVIRMLELLMLGLGKYSILCWVFWPDGPCWWPLLFLWFRVLSLLPRQP